jgi:hypothetical protein
MAQAFRQRSGLWVEYTFALALLLMLVRTGWHLWAFGYLPQPFFYEPSDTFMDWFNTAYWAHDNGVYDNWKSIYPPLSFIFLRVLSKGSCYQGSEGLTVRDCDWIGFTAMFSFFAINVVLAILSYRKLDKRTALPRGLALSLGLPMLYALERGNVIIICFTAMVLAFGPLIHSTRLRWLFVAIAVNFKVYLIATIASQLIRRRWLWVEGALLTTLAVYLLSYATIGGGTPIEIFGNINDYTTYYAAAQVLDIWYSATFGPLISLLEGSAFPVTSIIGSQPAEIGLIVLPALVHTGQAAIVLAAVASWLRPEVVSPSRLAFLASALALITSEAGGYTEALLLFFVFMEPWKGVARPIALVLAYLLCLPGDIIIGSVPPMVRDSYLAGHAVEVEIGIALGMFLRPGTVIAIAISLSLSTISDVWRDLKSQGWQGRWRFRGDARLLPWQVAPSLPDSET